MEIKKKDLKNILIVDLKTTCWDKKSQEGEYNEVVKFTIGEFNINEGKIIKQQTFFIKPKKNSISEFCKKVANINDTDLEYGITFPELCKELERKFNSFNKTWAAYGNFAKIIMQKQCKYEQIYTPLSNDFINIKNLYAIKNNLNSEIKLDKAFMMQNINNSNENKSDLMLLSYLLCDIFNIKRK